MTVPVKVRERGPYVVGAVYRRHDVVEFDGRKWLLGCADPACAHEPPPGNSRVDAGQNGKSADAAQPLYQDGGMR